MKISELELVKCFEEIDAISQLYASSKATFENLDRLKSYEYEVIASTIKAKTEVERKRLATVSPEWRKVLEKLGKANIAYVTSKIEYSTLNTKFDCLRSLLSIHKNSINKTM